MSSFDHYELESAVSHAKNMNCYKFDSLESLVSTLDCKWSTDEIESLALKEIYKTVCSDKEYEIYLIKYKILKPKLKYYMI
jgi:hypothetical protein